MLTSLAKVKSQYMWVLPSLTLPTCTCNDYCSLAVPLLTVITWIYFHMYHFSWKFHSPPPIRIQKYMYYYIIHWSDVDLNSRTTRVRILLTAIDLRATYMYKEVLQLSTIQTIDGYGIMLHCTIRRKYATLLFVSCDFSLQ